MIFTFSAVFYFSGEGNIAAIICYNGLMKSDFVEKKRKGESHGKKTKSEKNLGRADLD